jgi:Tol biopolymer transport system component
MAPNRTHSVVLRRLVLLVAGIAALAAAATAGGAPNRPIAPTGSVAVVGEGGLYIVGARAGAKRLVAYSVVSAPAWSPTGRGLAYLADGALRARSIASRRNRMLMRVGEQFSAGPAWSPRGGRLAMVVHSPIGTGPRLVVVRVDGQRQLALRGHVSAFQVPQWSPDGRWIAYLGDSGAGGEPAVWVVRPNGRDRHIVRRGAVEYADGVSWSPDGRQIAFAGAAGSAGDGSAVVVANADGKRSRLAASVSTSVDEATLADVTWSPRGGRIAFLRLTAHENGLRSSSEVWVTGPGGTRLLAKARYIDELAWSPDGRWLAYLAEDSYGSTGPEMSVRVVRADGTGAHRLTRLHGDAFGLAWAPARSGAQARVTS